MRFRATLLSVLILIPWLEAAAQAPPDFGVLTGSFPIKEAAGRKIKFTGYIKTEGITDGFAGLWWRADRADQVGASMESMEDKRASGTADWRRYEINLSMPRDITNISFGVLHPGSGTAWFADLKIEIDKEPYTTDQFDLGLTSSPPRGFRARGNNYELIVDTLQRYQGKPSFRIRRVR